MPTRLSPDKISRALPWLSDSEVESLFEGMKSAQKDKSCQRFNGRIRNLENDEEAVSEIKFFHALGQVWESGGSRFRFEEVDDFSLGVNGRKLVWSGHSEEDTGRKSSKPHRLLRVFQIDEDGNEHLLPLNVGFSSKSSFSNRFGGGEKLGGRLRTKDGKTPKGSIISAFVMDDKHPDYDALRDSDVRSKIETALMDLLKYSGKNAILSSILFNIRDNPLKGVYLALTGLYAKKGALTVLPINGTFLKGKRANLSHTKDAGDGKNNAVFWVAYLDEKTMDLSRLPKLNLAPLTGQEMEVLMKNPSVETLRDAYRRFASFINASYGVGKLNTVAEDGLIGYLPREAITKKSLLRKQIIGAGFTTALHEIVGNPDRERLLSSNAHATAKHLNTLLELRGKDCLVYKPDKIVRIKNPDGTFKEKILRRLDAEKTAANLDPEATPIYGIGRERYSLSYDENRGLCFKSPNDAILRSPGCTSQLKYVPPDLLDEKTLMVRNSQARTPLHIIAENAELHLLPAGVLTKKMLLCQDGRGTTPLSGAVRAGCLGQIPSELVPNSLFHTPCGDRTNAPKWYRGSWTLVDVAVCAGTANTLPKEVIAEVMNNEERAQELRALAEISGRKNAFEEIEREHESQLMCVGID